MLRKFASPLFSNMSIGRRLELAQVVFLTILPLLVVCRWNCPGATLAKIEGCTSGEVIDYCLKSLLRLFLDCSLGLTGFESGREVGLLKSP